MLAETDCRRKYRNTSLWVRFQDSGVIKANARANASRIAYALFLLKVVAEVIDPVMGSSQLGRIERPFYQRLPLRREAGTEWMTSKQEEIPTLRVADDSFRMQN